MWEIRIQIFSIVHLHPPLAFNLKDVSFMINYNLAKQTFSGNIPLALDHETVL